MKIAIMQPYLFPYLGYFQLINAVDFFGIGDDVQYINKGWINRNQILVNGEASLFTFSVKKDKYNKIIYERFYHENFDYQAIKFIQSLEFHYKKAPFYSEVLDLIKSIFEYQEKHVSNFNTNQLSIICKYLNINTTFISSLEWSINNSNAIELTQERVIKKLKKINATHFINPIQGSKLYDKDFFKKNGIKLNFLESNEILYKQFGKNFIPNLSIIDIMMFNSIEETNKLLNSYRLV